MVRAIRDPNRVTGIIVASSAADETKVQLWADPTTHRLYVDASVTVSGLADDIADGAAVDAGTLGYVVLGSDGSNYQVLSVNSSGYLDITVKNTSIAVTGTFWQATQPVSIASAQVASGALAAGSIAVGAITAGDTSIATTEDTPRAAAEHLVKIGLARLDTPVANANVSTDGDYTSFIADNFGKQWIAGAIPEDTAHISGEALSVGGSRRIATLATSSGSDGDWSTVNQSAEGAAWVTTSPTTLSGCLLFRSIDLDETEEEIKATAGNLYGYYFANTTASARYLKLYNATAANVTVGTTTPVATFYLPPTAAGHIGLPFPISFATAITAAATTGVADNDTGAPGANDVIFMAWYL